MAVRKLRLATCRRCRRMLAVVVTGEGIAPYHDECSGCGSTLDEASVARAAVPGD